MRRPPRPSAFVFLLIAGAPPAAPRAAGAQPGPAPGDTTLAARGLVTGQIVDAATGEALPGALVVLAPAPEGLIPPGGLGASAFPTLARRARTDAAGRYRFDGLAPGTYQLHATRLGYAPGSASLAVADVAPDVSLGLPAAPLALRPVEVRAAARRSPAGLRGGGDPDTARVGVAAARQGAYLTTDARELTRADVGEAVTLAESDLFRALHRLPGVSTRDEWAAELWTRGARPDLTRVTLDGLPLFGPVAAFGALSAVSADAVASATLLPGVRPASVAEGGAAVLDLRTRAGGRLGGRGSGGVDGSAELGVASARLSMDGTALGGRAGWTATGRRSYVDGIARLAGAQQERAPGFGDLTARADLRLSPTQAVAVSGLLQHTFAGSGWFGLRGSTRGAVWGNRLLRATHAASLGGLRVAHTLGGSAHAFSPRGALDLRGTDDPFNATTGALPGLLARRHPDVRVSALVLRGEVSPEDAAGGAPGAGPAWRAGYDVTRQRTRYAGPARGFFTGDYFWRPQPVRDYTDDSTRVDTARFAGAVTVGALWAERRWSPVARLTIEPGVRLEVAGGNGAPAAVRPSPRVAARFTPDGRTRVSAALGRSVQYTQALPPVGPDESVRFYPGALWLTAGRNAPGSDAPRGDVLGGDVLGGDVPALTTDLATLGAERWLGRGWLASVNAYARRTRGLVTNDPAPGLAADRALFVVGGERGQGVELAARRLVGRTTATLGYTWARSTLDAGGWRYASPQDRTHALDATVSHRLTPRWRIGGAFSAATGTPYARTVEGYLSEDPDVTRSGRWLGLVRDVPSGRRHPGFFGADLVAEYTRRVRGAQVGAFVQVHSPLAEFTNNAYESGEGCVAPVGSAPAAVLGPTAQCFSAGKVRSDAVPLLPLAGLRVAF